MSNLTYVEFRSWSSVLTLLGLSHINELADAAVPMPIA